MHRPTVGLAYAYNNRRWNFDWRQIEAAMIELGIRNEVSIRVSTGSNTRGAHRVKRVGSKVVHSITISRFMSIEQASRTLWHELAHAMQAERLPDPTKMYAKGSAYRKAGVSGEAYRQNPFELEANRYESGFPLVVSL